MSQVREYLLDREAVLLDLIEELKARMVPLENELADVRRAKAALGPAPATLLDVARRLATGPPGADPTNFSSWTLKQMAIRALTDHFQEGATAIQLLDFFKTAYGRDIPRESLSPQLSRLAEKDKLLVRVGKLWKLAPKREPFNAVEQN
jgi:hypothetical protein